MVILSTYTFKIDSLVVSLPLSCGFCQAINARMVQMTIALWGRDNIERRPLEMRRFMMIARQVFVNEGLPGVQPPGGLIPRPLPGVSCCQFSTLVIGGGCLNLYCRPCIQAAQGGGHLHPIVGDDVSLCPAYHCLVSRYPWL